MSDDGPDGPGGAPQVPSPAKLMTMMKSKNGIQSLMLEPVFPTEAGVQVSQAAVLADVINIYRIDAKMDGSLHDIDIEIDRITERKVAWMLDELISGNPGPLIDCFNAIEDFHHEVFKQEMGDDEYDEFVEAKQSTLYTHGAGKSTSPAEDGGDAGA